MKTSGLALLVAVVGISGAAWSQENRVVPSPRPRVRLDPVTRAAIPEPPSVGRADAREAVQMSPFVVRSTSLLFSGPEQEPRPTGAFSPLTGGWLVRKKLGPFEAQVGVWPYYNIFWKSDRFKSEAKHVTTEFVRISW